MRTSLAFAATFAASALACTNTEYVDSASSAAKNGGIRGAIFTTLADGTRVNANIYEAKTDVYLDGGPGANAPSGAAALAAGDYYFQVTDPSGKTLLSTDDITCRSFRVNDDGVIEFAYAGASGCQHTTGTDVDHASLGAITVQLMPYLDTPNPGGEYKVWVTPVARYADGEGRHGFISRWSKTDNFKVKTTDGGEPPPPPPPPPCCGDGHVDAGEECDDGNTTSGDGCSATCTLEAPPPPEPCCGDGHVDAGEDCDDGNTTSGDGCSATCTAEAPPPEPCCGDGHLDPGEQCDDGNLTNGDGCSSQCKLQGSH